MSIREIIQLAHKMGMYGGRLFEIEGGCCRTGPDKCKVCWESQCCISIRDRIIILKDKFENNEFEYKY